MLSYYHVPRNTIVSRDTHALDEAKSQDSARGNSCIIAEDGPPHGYWCFGYGWINA